ncbi:hypothetical protein BASA81_003585 [Batrachochytrium salamandrivorans]|nr:hypothetical protein BASA81_003585 [Batrachochytrium salamandrivorans]
MSVQGHKTEFTQAELAEMLSQSANIALTEQDIKSLLDMNGFLVILAPLGKKLKDNVPNEFRIVRTTEENKVLSPGQANNLPISTRFDEMLALEKPLYQTNVVQFDLKLHQDFDSVQSTNVCVGLNSWLHTRVNQFLVK